MNYIAVAAFVYMVIVALGLFVHTIRVHTAMTKIHAEIAETTRQVSILRKAVDEFRLNTLADREDNS